MTARANRQQAFADKQRAAILAAIKGDTAQQLRLRIDGMHRAGLEDHAIARELQLPVDEVRRALAEGVGT